MAHCIFHCYLLAVDKRWNISSCQKKTAAAAASSETENNIQFECAQFLNIQNEIRYTKGHTF